MKIVSYQTALVFMVINDSNDFRLNADAKSRNERIRSGPSGD